LTEWLSYKAIIYVIGFAAQILFSARLLFQWIQSEKLKKVSTPQLFWILSLIASFLLFTYGWLRNDFAIMFVQMLTYFIYIRNMQLQGTWPKLPYILRSFLWLFPFIIIAFSFMNNRMDLQLLFSNEEIPLQLLMWGSLAQLIFTFRFVYQWLYSEKKKESSLPMGFWLISLVGAVMILAYAIIRKDPVLLLGQSFGFVIYARNLIIGKRQEAN